MQMARLFSGTPYDVSIQRENWCCSLQGRCQSQRGKDQDALKLSFRFQLVWCSFLSRKHGTHDQDDQHIWRRVKALKIYFETGRLARVFSIRYCSRLLFCYSTKVEAPIQRCIETKIELRPSLLMQACTWTIQ